MILSKNDFYVFANLAVASSTRSRFTQVERLSIFMIDEYISIELLLGKVASAALNIGALFSLEVHERPPPCHYQLRPGERGKLTEM
jgi:hypothetical protein